MADIRLAQTLEEYDDALEVENFLREHFRSFMTAKESQAVEEQTRALIESSTYLLQTHTSKEQLRSAKKLKDEINAIQNDALERVRRDYWAGRLQVNRCPECSRVVKTPLAKQCLWCGHDWH